MDCGAVKRVSGDQNGQCDPPVMGMALTPWRGYAIAPQRTGSLYCSAPVNLQPERDDMQVEVRGDADPIADRGVESAKLGP